MDDIREFLVLRYSLVEESQTAITASPIPSPKGAALLPAISEDREFSLNGVRYSFVGFENITSAVSVKISPTRFYIGKVAKLKQAHVGKKVPGDIVETQQDDWLPLITVIDIEKQYIVVRKDYRFGTPEQTMRAIQAGLREPIKAIYNHRVFVEGCTREEYFWEIVDSHRKFYKLELKLISPNILETNMRARESLAAMKNLFSQDQVNITLSNESGDLHVPPEPVSDYLDYIKEGEGSWALTTEGQQGGKKTYSSAENVDTVSISLSQGSNAIDEHQLSLLTPEEQVQKMGTSAEIVAQVHSALENYRDR